VNLRTRYYLAALSPAAMDLTVSLAFVLLAGRPLAILVRLPEVVILLLGVNWVGARIIFRPIARHLSGEGPPEPALRRIARLPVVSAWWCLAVTVVFSLESFIYAPLFRFDVPATPDVLIVLASRALIWCTLMPYTVYFLTSDVARRLRRLVFERAGVNIPAQGGSIRRKLILAIVGAVFMPVVSVTTNLLFVPERSPITDVPNHVIVAVTFVASLLALAAAIYALSRALAEPIVSLIRSMRRVQAGDLTIRVPVEADDEIGKLAENFNALVGDLERSRGLALAHEAEAVAATRQFHEAQKREALGRLAGGIAHDFNNILAIMLGYTEVVQRRLDDEKARGRLSEVMKAGERAKQLIRQILQFTRGEEPGLAPVALGQLTLETAEWLRATAPANVKVSVAVADADCQALANATQLTQVLTNLCVNAFHAIGDGQGKVEIELARVEIDGGRADGLAQIGAEGDNRDTVRHAEASGDGRVRCWAGLLRSGPHARISVADSGTGIEFTTMQRMFDPYFTTKKIGEGTGLGLAAVLGIIRQHDGAIAVESRPGHGTRFEVFLPLSAVAVPRAQGMMEGGHADTAAG